MNNIIYIGGNKKMLTELTNQNYNELTSADKEELEKLKESNQSEWLKHNRDRRLTFESYLYTLCRSGRLDNIKFNHGIYKISRPGQAVKLIIKQYWLDGYQKRQATYIK